MQVSIIGVILHLIYVGWYYAYTKSKMTTWLYFGLTMALTSAIIFYVIGDEPESAKHKLGMIVTVFMMVLIASPLFSLVS